MLASHISQPSSCRFTRRCFLHHTPNFIAFLPAAPHTVFTHHSQAALSCGARIRSPPSPPSLPPPNWHWNRFLWFASGGWCHASHTIRLHYMCLLGVHENIRIKSETFHSRWRIATKKNKIKQGTNRPRCIDYIAVCANAVLFFLFYYFHFKLYAKRRVHMMAPTK